MNRILSLFFIISCLVMSTAAVRAAEPDDAPVKWSISSKMTGDDSGILTLTATPAKGWHLYGTELPAGGPKPTVFDLSGSTGLTFEGTPVPAVKPLTVDDPLFGVKLTWWASPVSFTVKFRLDKGRTSARVKAKVTYMACDDNTCAPPSSITLYRNIKK